MRNDNKNKTKTQHKTVCLLEKRLTRANRSRANRSQLLSVIAMGRICVDISDELEKKFRFKTVEKFGGRKGDLARAVEEALETWVAKL